VRFSAVFGYMSKIYALVSVLYDSYKKLHGIFFLKTGMVQLGMRLWKL
jgi:hypothetical protein